MCWTHPSESLVSVANSPIEFRPSDCRFHQVTPFEHTHNQSRHSHSSANVIAPGLYVKLESLTSGFATSGSSGSWATLHQTTTDDDGRVKTFPKVPTGTYKYSYSWPIIWLLSSKSLWDSCMCRCGWGGPYTELYGTDSSQLTSFRLTFSVSDYFKKTNIECFYPYVEVKIHAVQLSHWHACVRDLFQPTVHLYAKQRTNKMSPLCNLL